MYIDFGLCKWRWIKSCIRRYCIIILHLSIRIPGCTDIKPSIQQAKLYSIEVGQKSLAPPCFEKKNINVCLVLQLWKTIVCACTVSYSLRSMCFGITLSKVKLQCTCDNDLTLTMTRWVFLLVYYSLLLYNYITDVSTSILWEHKRKNVKREAFNIHIISLMKHFLF